MNHFSEEQKAVAIRWRPMLGEIVKDLSLAAVCQFLALLVLRGRARHSHLEISRDFDGTVKSPPRLTRRWVAPFSLRGASSYFRLKTKEI
jgi:hypothetical protein